MYFDNNLQSFFALLNAGLWEHEVQLLPFKDVDFSVIYRLSEEQSVQGLITAGAHQSTDVKVSRPVALHLIGNTMQIEKRNKALNEFVYILFEKLKVAGVEALLVKGQGIAQCYERPLWRASGDVDLLLDKDNYEKAKTVLASLAETEEQEVIYRLHKAYGINGWEVELHGNMRGRFLKRIDRVVDDVQKNMFERREFRKWECGETEVLLPSIDNDIIFVFTHILQHFFIEGIGLRQICDWCRLLWTYRAEIDVALLERRLYKMGVMTEWKTFGSLAVEFLGMPADAMPFYDVSFKKKGKRALSFVLETGNFGYKRHVNETFRYPVLVRKVISFFRHTWDGIRYFRMFPLDAINIWLEMICTGIHVAIKGA